MFNRSSEYYDLIYEAIAKDYEAETRRLRKFIQAHGIQDDASLLDVGCGTGGHLAHLLRHYSVEGLDLDEGMLALARSKLPGIPFHVADMVEFDLGRTYDVVISLFSSIGYARTEARLNQAIRRMADHAREGGLVIVEPWFGPDSYRAGIPHAVFVDKPDVKIARLDVSQMAGGVSVLDFHFLVADRQGVDSFTERHELGLFTQDQYLSAFEDGRLEATYEPQGIDGRGLYFGVRSSE